METRVAYTDSTRKLTWESNDQILLAGYDGSSFLGSETFTYSGTGDTFNGTSVAGATTYRAYYPAGAITLDDFGNVQLSATFWQQTQSGNNSTAHLSDKLLLIDEIANAIDETFNLILKSDIIKFDLSDIPINLGVLNQLIWTIEGTTGQTRSMTLNMNGISSGTTCLTAYLAFAPAAMRITAGDKVKITLIGDDTYEWNTIVTNNKTYVSGNRYTANVAGPWNTALAKFRFTIKTIGENTSYTIWQQSTSSISPAKLRINWGDGTDDTIINQGDQIPNKTIASHTYANAGDYTVTIYSNQLNTSLQQIPHITFNNGTVGDPFLTTILDPFLNMEATSFSDCFAGCTGLTAIPAGLFDNNIQAICFNKCFSGCIELNSIPAELFKYNTQATDFYGCFEYCTGLDSIPEAIFETNTKAKRFDYCFLYCTGLDSIPPGLFYNNTQAIDFGGCFQGCTGLTAIPAEMFNNNKQATQFFACFAGCSGLTDIPPGLFNENTKAERFDFCFTGCTGLTAIPTGLFNNNLQANDFSGCFAECTGLTAIPEGLFNNNTQAIDFSSCFAGCTGLTAIPVGLFNNNTQAQYFHFCFNECTNLTSVPVGLFNKNTQAEWFKFCFCNCKKLVLIEDIFPLPSVNPDFFVGRTMDFEKCFYNVGIQAASPGAAPKLWNFTGGGPGTSWTVTNCFTNANVTNYGDIPPNWKGL
ncbi:MAG: hypothetical protein KA074_02450 [Bacteroidales bacterium]|jgi:hypothetical protein|nr:hypothetical protein [Bacteroidales bacterium]